VVRELLWGLRVVSHELDTWRSRASAIPDVQIREEALRSIDHKRDNAEGAGLFWTLTNERNRGLLRLLVTYQTIWDCLDNVSERGASAGERNGHQLHLALTEALDPTTPVSDYYCHHPWKQDGGYLQTLVEACRESCAALPSYPHVRDFMQAGVTRCSIQRLNHDPDPTHRDAALRLWASREFPGERSMTWFELTAAASAFTPHPLLAIAAESSYHKSSAVQTYDAYSPWVALAIAMLDSYADQFDDALSTSHSYISHYHDEEVAVRRVCEIVDQALHEVRRLRNGHRHTIIVASMIAMYLSKNSARTPEMRDQTQRVAQAGGYLTQLLLLILRAWRLIHIQRITGHGERIWN
jgi:tetraprenyl-beta-curcumene synthase